jgi:hypothetical protein
LFSPIPVCQPTPAQLEEARALRCEKRERFLFAVESMGVSYLRRRPGGGVSELVAELFPRAASSGSESAHAMAHPCTMSSAEDVFAATASLPAVAADNALSTSTPLAAQSPSPPSLATAARLPSAFAPSVRSLAQAQQQHEQIVAQHQHFQHMQRMHSQQAQQAQLIAPPGGKSGAFVQQLAHIQALLQLEQERFSRQQAEQLMLHQSTMMRLTAAAAAAAASAVEASEAGVSAAASAANVLRLQRVNSLAGSISQLVSEGSAPPSPVGREASESARTVVLAAPSGGGGGAKRPRSVSGDGGCSLGDEVGSASSSGSASPSQEPAFKRECALASLPTFVGGPLRPLAVPMPAAHAPVPGLPSHLDVATLALMVKS